ncbi:ATP-binding protein [Candidatus Neomarinimicrobiota bacterium]
MKATLSPNWDELEPVRQEAHDFLQDRDLQDDIVYSTVMVLSELLENSIKYGHFKDPDSTVRVSLDVDSHIITVAVTNPVNEGCYKDLEKLDKMIQWVRGYQDPFEAYVERMKEVSKKSLHDTESGLGIVRIAYEGSVTIDFFVSDEDLLTVSAIRIY